MISYDKGTYKSFAKINIFLKIIGRDDKFHFIMSRFSKLDFLFDEMKFVKTRTKAKTFHIDGKNLPCSTKDNLIFKLYQKLIHSDFHKEVIELFDNYDLYLDKCIPVYAGLGGGSSNVAVFFKMINQKLNLQLSISDMVDICDDIGSDIAFFLYDYNHANVFGKGEKVEEFQDRKLDNITLIKSKEKCDTKKVYQEFRNNYNLSNENETLNNLLNQPYSYILDNFKNQYLNDLFDPVMSLYPSLKVNTHFLSGSGNTMYIKE